MSKKINKNKPPAKTVKVAAKSNKQGNAVLALLILVVATLACFSNAFNNDFTNWDDPTYVINNPTIQSLSFENIKIFFSSFSMGNYHPLSILSLAIDYHFFKMNPHGYHATSIIIHLFNVILVFLFVRLLTERVLVAFITALLFGIHPMHVESVSWISERKDVLYLFFYMASLCSYILFTRTQKKKVLLYSFTILLFICSLLSKAQAVTLPVVLILIDYFAGRKTDKKAWLEKIPFFLIAIASGIVAVIAQKQSGAITDIPIFPLVERILFASFSFLNYIAKLILPENLSAYYPYPAKSNDTYPLVYYAAPFVSLALVFLVARFFKKKKSLFFGFTFFVVNIFLLLQLLPVGGSMMSERYTYLCYIGLFFIVGNSFYDSWFAINKKLSGYKYLFAFLLIVYTSYIGYRTVERNKLWKNSELLWSNVIKQFKTVVIAYNNRGSYYQKEGKIDIALEDFNEALRLKPDHTETLINRSDVYRVKGNYDLSIADCNKVITKGFNSGALMNRGIAYCMAGRFDEAFTDFVTVIAKDPKNSNVYCNRGNLFDMRGQLDSALADYSMAISLKPDYADAFYNRGKTYMRKSNYDSAISDFNSAVEYKTKNYDVYFFRSQAYKAKGDYANALQDAYSAQQMGKPVDAAYLNELQSLVKR